MSDSNYVFDFSSFANQAGSQGGMSFMGGASPGAGGSSSAGEFGGAGGGSASGGAPGAMGAGGFGGAGGGSSFGGAPGGAPGGMGAGGSGADLTSLLQQSPFGALLNLPGVTAANLFSNVNPNDYAGGNPFAALGSSTTSGAYGGNPFAGLGSNYSGASGSSGPGSMGGMFGGIGQQNGA